MRNPKYKHENELDAKVKAYNAAAKCGNELYRTLRAFFEPLVGQKILKADGSLLAKYAKLIPKFECEASIHVYRHTSEYSLAWCAKACEHVADAEHCTYQEVTVYIGNLSGDTLKELSPEPNFKENHSADEVRKLREVLVQKKRELDSARSALYPFGEHDN